MPKIMGKVIKEEFELIDIICDRCNLSCKKYLNYEYAEIKAHWGYDSQKDEEKHVAYLCETCYDKVISDMLIKVAITNLF